MIPEYLISLPVLASTSTALIVFISFSIDCKRKRTRTKYKEEISSIENSLANVSTHIMDLREKQDSFDACSKMGEKTKALAEDVIDSLNQIIFRSDAATRRVLECKTEASKETALGYSHLAKARNMISEPFEFENGAINSTYITKPYYEKSTLRLSAVIREIENIHGNCLRKMTRLNEAIKVRESGSAASDLTIEITDEVKKLEEIGVAAGWLGCPLVDEAERINLIKVLDLLRQTDPVAYLERISEIRKTYSAVPNTIKRISSAISKVKEVRVSEDSLPKCSVQAEYDPMVALNRAQKSEAEFTKMLSIPGKIDDLIAKSREVTTGYTSVAPRVAEIKRMITYAEQSLERATFDEGEASKQAAKVGEVFRIAKRRYKNIYNARTVFAHGEEALAKGKEKLAEAKTLMSEYKYTAINDRCTEARNFFVVATNYFNECTKECGKLDKERALYEDYLSRMEYKRDQAQNMIKSYRSVTVLDPFEAPVISSRAAIDYKMLTASLQSIENGWNKQVDIAYKQCYSHHYT